MADQVIIKRNARGIAELEDDLAFGLYTLALVGELEAKREAPVRGGYRSFNPGGRIGGTLRRSIHAVGFRKDGSRLAEDNESGRALPTIYVPVPGHMVAYVGTNSGYGAYVELGTSRMAARPFIAPGLEASMQNAAATIRNGVARVRASGR
jgi:hypothetical protein